MVVDESNDLKSHKWFDATSWQELCNYCSYAEQVNLRIVCCKVKENGPCVIVDPVLLLQLQKVLPYFIVWIFDLVDITTSPLGVHMCSIW